MRLVTAFLILVVAIVINEKSIYARLTGTNPTGSQADVRCDGPKGAEACVDYLGDVIPTTNNVSTSGTSSLQWKSVEAKKINAGGGALTMGGSVFGVMPTAVTVTANAVIDPTTACGGTLLLAANANVTANAQTTFVTAVSANQGCIANIVNTGGGAITLNTVANFPARGYVAVGSIVLNTDYSIVVDQIGSKWVQIGTVANNF